MEKSKEVPYHVILSAYFAELFWGCFPTPFQHNLGERFSWPVGRVLGLGDELKLLALLWTCWVALEYSQ